MVQVTFPNIEVYTILLTVLDTSSHFLTKQPDYRSCDDYEEDYCWAFDFDKKITDPTALNEMEGLAIDLKKEIESKHDDVDVEIIKSKELYGKNEPTSTADGKAV